MKKTDVAHPNLLLREERELRGWSQRYVADAIGADRYYLSRWEHGTASPSPYYRQKLCELFEKNARELGMLCKKSQSMQEEGTLPSQSTWPGTTPGPIFDPLLPGFSSGSPRLIGRDAVLQQLRIRLCNENGRRQVALSGLPGVRKTTLVIALAHDKHVQEHFTDGVLWAGLGPTPDVIALAHHWATLLNVSPQQAASLKNATDWTRALRQSIGSRKILLVLDDAW